MRPEPGPKRASTCRRHSTAERGEEGRRTRVDTADVFGEPPVGRTEAKLGSGEEVDAHLDYGAQQARCHANQNDEDPALRSVEEFA